MGLLVCLSRYSWALGDSYLSGFNGVELCHTEWDTFSRGAHAHITRLRNGAISGYIIIISGHFVIAPGHCMISPWFLIMAFIGYYGGLTLGQGLSGGYMM